MKRSGLPEPFSVSFLHLEAAFLYAARVALNSVPLKKSIGRLEWQVTLMGSLGLRSLKPSMSDASTQLDGLRTSTWGSLKQSLSRAQICLGRSDESSCSCRWLPISALDGVFCPRRMASSSRKGPLMRIPKTLALSLDVGPADSLSNPHRVRRWVSKRL